MQITKDGKLIIETDDDLLEQFPIVMEGAVMGMTRYMQMRESLQDMADSADAPELLPAALSAFDNVLGQLVAASEVMGALLLGIRKENRDTVLEAFRDRGIDTSKAEYYDEFGRLDSREEEEEGTE